MIFTRYVLPWGPRNTAHGILGNDARDNHQQHLLHDIILSPLEGLPSMFIQLWPTCKPLSQTDCSWKAIWSKLVMAVCGSLWNTSEIKIHRSLSFAHAPAQLYMVKIGSHQTTKHLPCSFHKGGSNRTPPSPFLSGPPISAPVSSRWTTTIQTW